MKASDYADVETNGRYPADADPPREPMLVRSAGELIDTFPRLREPLIDGLLRVGETMNLIAPPKAGKSWIVLALILSIATGRPWLGRFQTRRGRVLLVDNELHGESTASRIRTVAEAMNITRAEYADTLHVCSLRGRLRNLHSVLGDIEELDGDPFSLIALDALYRMVPTGVSENDNAGMMELYNGLDSTAGRLGCSFVLIHHTSKGSQSGKAVTDVGSGAGSQSRAADAHVTLRPHEESGVLIFDGVVRSWQPIEPFGLRWTFPLFEPADGVDVSKLAGLRGERQSRSAKIESEWTPARLMLEIVTKPMQQKSIIGGMMARGLTKRAAEKVFAQTQDAGLLVYYPRSSTNPTNHYWRPANG